MNKTTPNKKTINTLVLHRVVKDKTDQFIDIQLPTLIHILTRYNGSLVSLEQAFQKEKDNEQKVCLTFDDGFSSDYDIVLPELKKVRAKATFFIVTDLIGKPGYMTKEQIKSLSEAGMQIGSHSVSHPNFLEIYPEEREKEFIESKLILERIIDKEITCFSFPFGFYNFESIDAAFSAGYSMCCTSDHGLSFHNQKIICRNSINVNTSIERVDSIMQASLSQRIIWFCEDKSKSLMKKFMPKIYVYIRNVLSRF